MYVVFVYTLSIYISLFKITMETRLTVFELIPIPFTAARRRQSPII